MLRPEDLIPRELFVSDGAIRTDVVEAPETRFASDTAAYRPLRGGCEIGAGSVSGTLGGVVYDATDNDRFCLPVTMF